jgi:uncharacterized LabA/DUF88 family protein
VKNLSEEERLKIAVFIDFDNIAIGVKQSLNRNFDVGTVLEAIKERGEVVTKIAYGDWKRAEDFSRAMTQHAVQMVQRNLTPGGDKNGADIALALDALEMAFTRNHINAFVIVGGDSDFIALVEKLKQYDKTVLVVGGRAFTSVILQKNCHEFISYENLVGIQSGARKTSGKAPAATSATPLAKSLPLIRRALKVLSDREVSPQLGLLKSTLLQLDSTFSERDYGVSTFREFAQKLADSGHVNLKQVDRSLLVELKESEQAEAPKEASLEPAPGTTEPPVPSGPPQPHSALQSEEAIRSLSEFFQKVDGRLHWPMYLRGFKQFLRAAQPPFDEKQYGFSSIYDLVRQAQREGLLRVERNRQGILRIFPGDRFPSTEGTSETVAEPAEVIPEQLPSTPAREAEASATPAVESSPAQIPLGFQAEPAAEQIEELKERPKRRRRAASPSGTKPAKSGTRKAKTSRKKVASEEPA